MIHSLNPLAPVKHSSDLVPQGGEKLKRRSPWKSPFTKDASLHRLNVFSLPALGPLGHVELHGLALLQALEAARLNRREVHENIFAILTADKAVAFGVIEPLYCSLFCHVDTGVPFNRFTLERLGGSAGRLQAVEARAAHDRLGLTHSGMVPEVSTIR